MADPIEGLLILDISQALARVGVLDKRLKEVLDRPLKVDQAASRNSGPQRLVSDLRKVETQAERAARKLREVGSIKIAGLNIKSSLPIGQVSSLADKLKFADTRASSLRDRMIALQDAGAGMRRVGDVITASITVPVTAAAVKLTSLTTQFDAFLQRSVNLANLTAGEIGVVGDALLDMSKAVARGPNELAEAFYFVSSSGVINNTAQALNLVRVSGEGAAIGLGTTVDVAKLLTTEMAAFGDELGEPRRALDALIETIRQGKAEPEELVNQFGRVIPLVKQAGITATEGAGALAFLSRETNSASQATTFLINFLNKIVAPSKGAQKEAQALGFTFNELQQVFADEGFGAGIQFLRERVDVTSDSFKKLFPEIRAASGATLLLTADQAALGQTLEAVSTRTGQSADAIARLRQSQSFQFAQAKADLQEAAIRIGAVVVPSVIDFVERLADLAEAFSDLPVPVQGFVASLLGLLAVMGPLVAAGGRLTQALGLIGGAYLQATGQIVSGSAVATGAIATTKAALLGLGVTAGAVAAAFLVYEGFKFFKSFGEDARQLEKDINTLSDAAKANADAINVQGAAAATATELIRGYGDAIREAAGTLLAEKLADKNQVDDIERLGYTVEELTSTVLSYASGEEALNNVAARAARRNELTAISFTRVGNEMVGAELSASELVDAIHRYGVEAILAGETSLEFEGDARGLLETLLDARAAADGLTDALIEDARSGDLAAAAALKQSGAYFKLDQSQKDLVNRLLRQAEAMSDADLVAAGYDDTLNNAAEAIVGVGDAAGESAEEVEDFRRSLEELVGQATSFARLALDVRDGFDKISEGFFQTAGNLQDRKLIDPLLDQIDRLAEQAQEQLAQGFSNDEIQQNWSRDLTEAFARAGIDTQEEIDAFSAMFDIPLDITVATKIENGELVTFVTSVEESVITQDVTLGLVGEQEFTDTMTGLTKNRGILVEAEVEDFQARRDLDALTRNRRVTVDIETRRANMRNEAMGGIVHSRAMGGYGPHIARDGANLVRYAEPGTGGEAYIPLANDRRRGRAVAITQAVAKKFGYQLTPMAEGGLLSEEMNQALGRSFDAALEPAIMKAAKQVQKTNQVELVAQAFQRLISRTLADFLDASSIDFGPVSFADGEGNSSIASALSEAAIKGLASAVDATIEPAIAKAAKLVQDQPTVELMAQKLRGLTTSALEQFFRAADAIGPLTFVDDPDGRSAISEALSSSVISALTTTIEKTVEPALGKAATELSATPLIPELERNLRRLISIALGTFFHSAENLGSISFTTSDGERSAIGDALSSAVVGALSTTIETVLAPAIENASATALTSRQTAIATDRLRELSLAALDQFATASFDVGPLTFRDTEGASIINRALSDAVVTGVTSVLDVGLQPAIEAAAAKVASSSSIPAVADAFGRIADTVLARVASLSAADIAALVGNDPIGGATVAGGSTALQDSGELARALANLEAAYRNTNVNVNMSGDQGSIDADRLAKLLAREQRMRNAGRN